MSAFMYEIKEGSKVIVPKTWETDVRNTLTFGEVYENVAPEAVADRRIEVKLILVLKHHIRT